MSSAPPARFCRYVLRTTDAADAVAFYTSVLGGAGDGVVDLPAAAAARGAPAHWMGYIGLETNRAVQAMTAAWLADGATRLGPPRTDGTALLRDGGGAVVGLMATPNTPSRAGVTWHQLLTPAPDANASAYASRFSWDVADALVAASTTHRLLSWGDPLVPCGWVTDTTLIPGAHPHWLYYFGVEDVAASTALVRDLGGTVAGLYTLPDGRRVAPCEDRQRAAFGLIDRAPASPIADSR